ncbi:hypothetical protein BKA70DRAFT_1519944 [Coprinopsis sp. MPI-PUGE-AT-0042]|nr:hypothetical protein BKA70DRAFT_1519944 [Coprinopsis sp. MPI-PUGE-AT-0042]
MAAKFLCCLPLRLGVFIFTLLQFLVSGAAAGLFWYIVFSPDTSEQFRTLADYVRTTVIVVASVYTFTALVGLVGFLGAIFKKTAMIKTFFGVLVVSFLIQLASSIWFIVVFFRARALGQNDDCEDVIGIKGVNVVALCDSLRNLKDVSVASIIVPTVISHLITIYMIYVTYHYIQRVKDQNSTKGSAVFGTRAPAYAPLGKSEEAQSLTHSQPQYPYADTAHSFGHNAGYPSNTAYDPSPKSHA